MTRYDYIKDRASERRIYLLALLGGKCAKCNAINSLEFDHKDPSTKLFSIGPRLGYYSLDRLIDEAKKCQLLCYNCHLIKHNKKEVEHGGGVAGKWKCKCNLCLSKKAEYYFNKHHRL